MLATRVLYAKFLNKGKLEQLKLQAKRLGVVRSMIWQEYGALKGLGITDRAIRDLWISQKRDFKVLATPWKETLRDCFNTINLYKEAAKKSIHRAIFNHYKTDKERKEAFIKLKKDTWLSDSFLHRCMRKAFKHGKNKVYNQIIVRSDDYSVFELNSQSWLSIPSLIKGKRIKIPLNTTRQFAPSGTLRLIIRNDILEIHHSYEKESKADCGDKTLGLDKGYSEVFVDSEGCFYGKGLGKFLTQESDFLKTKNQRRQKLLSLARKYQKLGKKSKASSILKNNLGRKKLNKHYSRQKSKLKTMIWTACHQVVDKAKSIVCEDLTSSFSKKSTSKNTNRRLNSWVKGTIASALEFVSKCRGSTLHLINPAYTSQCDSFCHNLLLGYRQGNCFYRENGEVVQADYNAARNILARYFDKEISRFTPHREVKVILLRRTDSYRLATVRKTSVAKSSQ
ncbi:transposase [Helicobacter suis]|uniref:transposase n=1 Tax=Helicobacter suis TaxID=104628 RepID=UPI0013D2487E|nr:transposase [Helicobacter suis]